MVFTGEIDASKSKSKVTPREVAFVLKKVNEERWSNLLKDKGLNKSHVKIDWDKWVDSDAEDEKEFDTAGKSWITSFTLFD